MNNAAIAASIAAFAGIRNITNDPSKLRPENKNKAKDFLLLKGETKTMKMTERETVLVANINQELSYTWSATCGSKGVEIKDTSLEECLQKLITTVHAKEFQLSPCRVDGTRVAGYRVILKVDKY